MKPHFTNTDTSIDFSKTDKKMNPRIHPRILELAAKSGFDVERLMTPYPGGFPREDMLALECFAELIVQECANACYEHEDVESFGIYPIRVEMVTKACANNIRKHFEVE